MSCPVCISPKRQLIDAQLSNGADLAEIAEVFRYKVEEIRKHKGHTHQLAIYAPATEKSLEMVLQDTLDKVNLWLEGAELDQVVKLLSARTMAVKQLQSMLEARAKRPFDEARYLAMMEVVAKVVENYPEAREKIRQELALLNLEWEG